MLEQSKSAAEALEIIGERSRDNGRTPMQWSAEKFAGFSNVEPWLSSPDNFTRFNVEAEERDNPDVIAYRRTLNAEELIVLCNFRGVESALDEKSLADYAQGYKKILGNYDGLADNLRPFEVVVFEK